VCMMTHHSHQNAAKKVDHDRSTTMCIHDNSSLLPYLPGLELDHFDQM